MDWKLKSKHLSSPAQALEYLRSNIGEAEYNNPVAELDPDSWEGNQSVHFYFPGWSTRGVECWHTGEEFVARTFLLASDDDYLLTWALMEFASEQGNELHITTDIKPEKVAVADLSTVFDNDWIRKISYQNLCAIFDQCLLDDNDNYLAPEDRLICDLPGPVRAFHIGPETIRRILQTDEFKNDETHLAIVDYVHNLMRIVQYPETFNLTTPAFLPAEDGSANYFVDGEEEVFVPASNFLVLDDHARGCWALLPQKHVREQFSAHFSEPEEIVWYDEYQFSLKPVHEFKYRSFVKAVFPLCQSLNIMPSSLLRDHGLIYPVE